MRVRVCTCVHVNACAITTLLCCVFTYHESLEVEDFVVFTDFVPP